MNMFSAIIPREDMLKQKCQQEIVEQRELYLLVTRAVVCLLIACEYYKSILEMNEGFGVQNLDSCIFL